MPSPYPFRLRVVTAWLPLTPVAKASPVLPYTCPFVIIVFLMSPLQIMLF